MTKFISMIEDKDKFENQIENFFHIKGEIEEIKIISAYFDLQTINEIYKFSKNNKSIEIQMFVDRYSSKFFSNQEINDKLIEISKCRNFNIFLVKSGTLFHSKLYYVKSDKQIKVSIGSLNFTYNAFQKNDEILNEYMENINKRSNYTKDIEEYIASLIGKSEKITSEIENNHKGSNLRSLLLDGLIYYESNEQESFSFKLKLPEDFKKIVTTQPPNPKNPIPLSP